MASNKKPRKAYKPKAVLLDPMGFVTESMKPLAEHDSYVLNWKVRTHGAMLALTQGKADADDLNTLVSARNICEALIVTMDLILGDDVLVRSAAALIDICDRGNRTGRPVMRAAEMQAMNDLMGLHDDLLDVITVRQMETAITYAAKELKAKRAKAIARPAWSTAVNEVSHATA